MDATLPSAANARELVCVDLRGLKPALVEHAKGRGVSASQLLREALTELLQNRSALQPRNTATDLATSASRVRLSLRLSREQREEILARAATAGLSLGGYVIALMRQTAEPPTAKDRAARIAALTRSNAELATLCRNIARLTALLRQGEVRAAQQYRQSLDALDADVRAHLALASEVLAHDAAQLAT